jgi:archaellum biogenesis ATPase FlaH
MISDFSRDEFVKILQTHLSPTSPIQSHEHLFGRQKQLQQIDQALCAPGRSIFIYGDRGVGKTSLAHTVAHLHQSAKHDPVLLACTPHTTFAGLMAAALAALNGHQTAGSTTIHAAKVGWNGVGVEFGRTRKEEVIPTIYAVAWDLNSIVAALLGVGASRNNENTVVIVDEFDRITSDEERGHFADFIKQLGDQRVPVRFVFCGVADSMQKLLGAHASSYRYVLEVKLSTLSWEARYEIIDAAAKALGVSVEDRPRYRIAAISDGFPHYVHRMCEQLFWQMFNDPLPCTAPTHDHYREAVAESVLGMEQQLKTTYEQAVMKDAPGYEQVLWAVADHADFTRKTESIYDSYAALMSGAEDDGEAVLDRQTVVARLSALKGGSCGQILSSPRKSWYQFRENIMRGYVRLRAEEQGCELALDYSAATSSSPALTWRPHSARRGKVGTTPRDWQKLRRPF